MLRRLLVKISRYVGAAGKADSAGTVLLTVRRAVLCLLRNYASVCLLWQLLDLLSYTPPEKRHALTAGAVTFLAVMKFLVAGLAQLCPRQGADDAVRTQTVGLLERQHSGLCLASEDAVHAAAVKSSRFRIGATVLTPSRLRCRMRTPASTPIRRTGQSFPAGRLETAAARPTSVKARTQSLLHSAGRKTLVDAGLLPYAVTALISYTGTAALLRRRKREA